MKRNVFCTAKQASQAQGRITAPVTNVKHHPKCYPLTDRLWRHKITCCVSRILRFHSVPLTMATDFSAKQQEQINRCTPPAEDRQRWGSTHQLWRRQGPSARWSIAFAAQHGNVSLSSVLFTIVSATWSYRKILPHTRSGNNSDPSYRSKTYLHLRKHKILRWKCTCWVSPHSVALQLCPISDTYRAGNSKKKRYQGASLKTAWREDIMNTGV